MARPGAFIAYTGAGRSSLAGAEAAVLSRVAVRRVLSIESL